MQRISKLVSKTITNFFIDEYKTSLDIMKSKYKNLPKIIRELKNKNKTISLQLNNLEQKPIYEKLMWCFGSNELKLLDFINSINPSTTNLTGYIMEKCRDFEAGTCPSSYTSPKKSFLSQKTMDENLF